MSERQTTPGLSSKLLRQILDVRGELERFDFSRGGLRFVLLSLLVLTVVGAIDFFVPLHMTLRIVVVGGLLIFGLVTFVRWLKHRETIDDRIAAAELEHANPQFGQRLRTVHQFNSSEDDGTPQLTSALIAETNSLAAHSQLASPIRWKSLYPWIASIGAVGVAILCSLLLLEETRVTLARVLLLPVHYSNLDVADLDPVVAGQDATITAVVTGRPLDRVELWVRDAEANEWTTTKMLPAGVGPEDEGKPLPLKGELTAKLEKCDHDIQYRIVASPLPAKRGALRVLQPLKQVSFQATIEPPTYTQMDTERVQEMVVTVAEGSMVSWELHLNRVPATAKLVSVNKQEEFVAPAISIVGSKIVGDLAQLESNLSYEVQAESADGMKFQSDRIRFRVKKDRGPTVAFQKPQSELEVTPTTEVGLSLRVTDDYGIGKVGVEYQINDGKRETLWEQDLAGEQKDFTTLPVMYLENHRLNFEDAITYYAFAEDNREAPQRTRSELQFIDIRPYKREYQVVHGSCQGSGNCLSLEELIKRQRHNLRRTFANLDRQPVQDSLSARLARSQREIRAATKEFTSGWERQFGPMPMLHAAVASMETAAEKLAAKALEPAMPLEESALADLVKAKQNARKFLKSCNSSGFSTCKNYDNAMAQKIRRPRSDDLPKDVAQTRQQVQKLAEKQKRFSEEVAASNGGAKLEKPRSLTQGQQSAAQQARQLQQAMQRSDVASESAQQKMDDALAEIEQSMRELEAGNQLSAAEQARRAAELLEQLDEQLQGLSEPDLAKRLAIVEQIASRLAHGQSQLAQALSGKGRSSSSAGSPPGRSQELAETQSRLASQAETLADLLRHLEADALGDDAELRQGLSELQAAHEPEALAEEMVEVSQQIVAESTKAARGAQRAADDLAGIASGLGTLRRNALQPQLDQLMAAEEMTAELLQAIEASRSQAELAEQYEELQTQLADLRISAKQASASAATSRGSNRAGAVGSSGGAATGPEFFYAGRARSAELRQVLNVLQARIQDAILLTARMDADEPVPLKYRELVSEYYQALSDDLR